MPANCIAGSAKSSMGAPMADEPDDKGNYTIRGVEIFATGKWNDSVYGPTELDEMVTAFRTMEFEPPILIGHKSDVGELSNGFVANLRRVGEKLIADFVDVPAQVYNWIKTRRLNAVSAEIYSIFHFEGKYSTVPCAPWHCWARKIPASRLCGRCGRLSTPSSLPLPKGP